MNDQEVVMEFEEVTLMIEVSQAVHGLFHWGDSPLVLTVRQTRIAIPVKLSTIPNLPMFSGQEPVPGTEGSIDQWLFQVEGALSTHTEEVLRSAVIGSVRGAAHGLLEFIGYGEEMDVISRHIKEHFGQGPSNAKLQKEFFLIEQ